MKNEKLEKLQEQLNRLNRLNCTIFQLEELIKDFNKMTLDSMRIVYSIRSIYSKEVYLCKPEQTMALMDFLKEYLSKLKLRHEELQKEIYQLGVNIFR